MVAWVCTPACRNALRTSRRPRGEEACGGKPGTRSMSVSQVIETHTSHSYRIVFFEIPLFVKSGKIIYTPNGKLQGISGNVILANYRKASERRSIMAKKTTTGLPHIGDVVLAWRKFRGLSSTKLADKAGVRIAYLSEIEHCKTAYPREEYLEKLAIALEVPLQDIYGRRMPPGNSGAGETAQSQENKKKRGPKEASPGIVFHTPLATKRQKILMHRIAVLEKKLETLEKSVHTVQEEVREVGALAKAIFREEESDAPTL